MRSTAAVLALSLGLAGCSTVRGQADAASSAALRLMTAVQGGDGRTACATLAPDTAADLEDAAKQPCAQAILDADLPAPGSVTAARVYRQWAQVVLSDDTMFLAAFPGGWRVVAAGCTPRQDRPYDCSLQGG